MIENMDPQQIGTASGLIFGKVERGDDGEIWSVHVALIGEDLRAEKAVWPHYATGFEDLAEFFDTMVEQWRGWDGDIAYESLEHDLRISARHLGSRIELRVVLAQTARPDGWTVSASFTLDAGEELINASRIVAAALNS
jgi:hypothetical protein